MENILAGKVVIITGASSGIGAATARLLAEYQCKLVLAALPDGRLQAAPDSLTADKLVVPTDVTVGTDVANMVAQTIEHFGRVDVLFANAGIYNAGPLQDGDPDVWAKLLDVNIDGVLRCVHAVLPHMIAQKSGDIVITSSIAGYLDIHGEPIYSASKHAIQGFTHTLRRQVSRYGIRVGAVAPGIIANELWGITDPAEIERLSIQEHLYLRSQDVAQAVAFMLSQPPHASIRDLVILPQNQDL